ncbi:hypothetical protein K040078D81_30390 [Blautia hominis]|uniref:Transposase n=1 Tax=Blautia hominis TaxID=2025493 RepID=A0ABQ0BBT9_9FIRM
MDREVVSRSSFARRSRGLRDRAVLYFTERIKCRNTWRSVWETAKWCMPATPERA